MPKTRRDFLSTTAGAAAALTLSRLLPAAAAADSPPLRAGMVGVGARGYGLLRTLLAIPGVEIRALCDIDEGRLTRAQDAVVAAKRPRPDGYGRNQVDYRRLCERDDLDLVLIATPWKLHTPVAVHAMTAGKHAAVEVPAADTVDDCRQLVETTEKTRRQCVMLENCCYFRNVMMVQVMLRRGLLGELIHCEAGYQHDTRSLDFDGKGDLSWRGQEYVNRNGNLYPTHAVGPIGQWANVNRGDRFDYLVSMSSKSRGLNLYAAEHFGAEHPRARQPYTQGDVNVTLLRTRGGITVVLYFDTQSPRPYDLIYRVQGTRGIYSGTRGEIYVEGRSPETDAWEKIDAYQKEFDHPLWTRDGAAAQDSGHGGADYVMLHRLVEAFRQGISFDVDVYDAATWSAIIPLTERSVAHRSRPVDVPDFTRGAWKHRRPLDLDI